MPYFPVDDDFAFHRKAVAAGNAAIGAWTRAGSWCKKEATGGFVPDSMAAAIGTKAEIRRLVEVGLWDKVLGGYIFHDWEDVGNNASGAVEEERREQQRAGWRERQNRKREREREERARLERERDGHGVTPGVTGPVTPPVSPWSPESRVQSPEELTLERQSSVPETSRERTDEVPPGVEYIDRAMRLKVDFRKVRARVAEQAGEAVPDAVVERIIVEALDRAKPRGGDRTGLVLTSVDRDWAEWSQLVYAGAAS